MQHVVVVVPVDAQVDEAQHVAQEHRQQRAQVGEIVAVRHLQLQHHDGDDDGEHAVAERLEQYSGDRVSGAYRGSRMLEGESVANRSAGCGGCPYIATRRLSWAGVACFRAVRK